MVALSRQTINLVKTMKPTLTYDLKKFHAEVWLIIETEHFSFIQNIIMNNVKRGIAEGFFRTNLNPDVISKLYLGMAHLVTTDTMIKNRTYPLEDLYKEMINYHLHGIINEKGRYELNTILNA